MKLYWHYVRLQFSAAMEYKTSFVLVCLGQFLVSFNVFLGVYFLFSRFHSVKGWSYEEILLCFGIVLLQYSLAECFARGFDGFAGILENGQFDRILLRPRSTILQVLGTRMEFTRIGRMVQAVVMFVYGLSCCRVEWTLGKGLVLALMLLCGAFVFAGLFLIYAALCFFTTEGLEFMNIFTDGAREYGRYPIDVFGKRILRFCTFVVPYALIQYYPLRFVLDRGARWYYGLLPLLSLLFLLPCYGLYCLGRRHYRSTGS